MGAASWLLYARTQCDPKTACRGFKNPGTLQPRHVPAQHIFVLQAGSRPAVDVPTLG